MLMGRLDDVGLQHQVLVGEFGRVGVVGLDAADFGRSQADLGGLLAGKEALHRPLVCQIELGVGAGDDLPGGNALRQQGAPDGATHHAAVAGDVYFL